MIDDSISTSVSHVDAHEPWNHIQRQFGMKNGQQVQMLKTELSTCRQRGLAIET